MENNIQRPQGAAVKSPTMHQANTGTSAKPKPGRPDKAQSARNMEQRGEQAKLKLQAHPPARVSARLEASRKAAEERVDVVSSKNEKETKDKHTANHQFA